MSEIKSNKISPRKGTTTTIGDSGDSVTISSGTTTTNAGTISTAGITGGTINNTTGTITGLQQAINWQTGSIKTTAFTASANEGYFLNTTSGQITVTLPASPNAGDVIGIKDYADTFDTNKAILNANGNKIQGSTTNFDITVEGTAAILLYVDSTKGWLLVDQSKAADISQAALFTVATGGTITTCGNFKIHTFTGPGTFCVSQIGNAPTVPTGGPSNVDYLVVAGGAGGGCGGGGGAGGGGAGGHRTSFPSPSCNAGAFPVTATAFPITVGAGGTSAPYYGDPGNAGSNSVFSTITSAGGGGGGGHPSPTPNNPDGEAGGSGGGGAGYPEGPYRGCGGAGNTPPVSPPQGNPGGDGTQSPVGTGGAGGGAGGSGGNGGPTAGGAGGNGTANSITGSPVTRAGGGGGATGPAPKGGTPGPAGPGGGGAGGTRSSPNLAQSGTANTGGGGGGAACASNGNGDGGSRIVIIRYKFQ